MCHVGPFRTISRLMSMHVQAQLFQVQCSVTIGFLLLGFFVGGVQTQTFQDHFLNASLVDLEFLPNNLLTVRQGGPPTMAITRPGAASRQM